MTSVLVTCPPMIGMKDHFTSIFEEQNVDVHFADVIQTLTEDELADLVPKFDGWIIGDDPASYRVFKEGKNGNLRAAIKWGVGTDNVDKNACEELGIYIDHTPAMFGNEVADVALGYLIALARETHAIDRGIRENHWPKNSGISIKDKTIGLIGYGDIGKNAAIRFLALGLKIIVYDPLISPETKFPVGVENAKWPDRISECDFLVFTCALTDNNYHMLNRENFDECKEGVRIVNVARGGLIDESALIKSLKTGHVHSAALDVFEVEPLPIDSPLRKFELCILGSHNSSNTREAVVRTSMLAIDKLFKLLEIDK